MMGDDDSCVVNGKVIARSSLTVGDLVEVLRDLPKDLPVRSVDGSCCGCSTSGYLSVEMVDHSDRGQELCVLGTERC